MSIEREAMLTVGWRVEQDGIPGFDERYDVEWAELEGRAERASELLGRPVWPSDLCEVENTWCGDTQIVGTPMYDREMPMDTWANEVEKLGELAKEVYRQVMRKEPEDGPYLMSWTRVF